MANNTTKLIIDVSARGIRSVTAAIKGLSRAMFGLVRFSFAKLFSLPALLGFGSVIVTLGATIKKAFDFESYQQQFEILLGSFDKASKRFKEIQEFSASTPFQIEGIIIASKHLTTFSEKALGGVESLRLIGDAAAATNQRIEDVGFWFGRAYAMIQGGKPFGEASMRLQEMGILSVRARQRMEDLQKSGANAAAVYAVLTEDFMRFNGGMEKLSKTGSGLFSTLMDNWTLTLATFGEELKELSKTTISELIEKLKQLREDGSITAWAQKAAKAAQLIKNVIGGLFEGGEQRQLSIDILVTGMKLAAHSFIDILLDGIGKVGAQMWEGFKGAVTPEWMNDVGSQDWWKDRFRISPKGMDYRAGRAGATGSWAPSTTAELREELGRLLSKSFQSVIPAKEDAEQDRWAKALGMSRKYGLGNIGAKAMYDTGVDPALIEKTLVKSASKMIPGWARPGLRAISPTLMQEIPKGIMPKLATQTREIGMGEVFDRMYGNISPEEKDPQLAELKNANSYLKTIAENTGGGIE